MISTYTLNNLTHALLKLTNDIDISNISIKDLCNEATISRTTFYRNFKDIYELLIFISNNLINNYHNDNKSIKNITDYIYSFLQVIKKNEKLFLLLYNNNLSELVINICIKNLQKLYIKDTPYAYAITYSIYKMIKYYFIHNIEINFKELVKIFKNTINKDNFSYLLF